MRRFRMRAYEQIATCYRTCQLHSVSMNYYKKALCLAFVLNDTESELLYYHKLAVACLNAGDNRRMVLYDKRATYGLLEPKDSDQRRLAHLLIIHVATE